MTTEPPSLGPLSTMVKELLDEPGMSMRLLASRTYDEEQGREILPKDFWSDMKRGVLPRPPTREQIEWMARAMRERQQIISEAAAEQFFGYRPVHLSGYDDDTRRIIVQAVAMPPAERRRVRTWIEGLPVEESTN